MSIALGIVMDPIGSITPYKDSSLAMLLAAQRRDWQLWYLESKDLYLRDGKTYGAMRPLTVYDSNEHWFDLADYTDRPLTELDVVLMRVDPPYNMEYIYTTFLLQRAAEAGVLVVNRPDSLRLISEKLYISWFSELCVATLVTADIARLRAFLQEQQDVIIKPLDGMGGHSIFRVRHDDPNTTVILETMTANNHSTVMAQRYIPEITAGDKRILLIDGEPVPYALARIPAAGETRGNLAAGGRGVGQALTERDREICARVGPALRELGIVFAGIDVIGDYLTEINVTSPTCIRELDALYQLDIAGQLLDTLHHKLATDTASISATR